MVLIKSFFSMLNRYLCPKLLSVLHHLLRSCTTLPSRSWHMLDFVLLQQQFLHIHPTRCPFRYSTKWQPFYSIRKPWAITQCHLCSGKSWLVKGLEQGQEVGSQLTDVPPRSFSLGLALIFVLRSHVFSGHPVDSACWLEILVWD